MCDGVADIGKFARSVNPLDPWNATHLPEYLAGLSGTLAGVADIEFNPGPAVKGLLGSGWGSDPFQAFGKLVPNVALTVFTDGGGAAADVSDASRLGDLAADDPALNAASRDARGIDGLGDPVDPVTGDVLLRQSDVSLPGSLPLVIGRVHRSSQRGGRWFGESWASSLDQRAAVLSDRIVCVLDGGQVLVYRREHVDGAGSSGSSAAGNGTGPSVLPVTGPAWPLTRAGDGYEVTDRQRGLTWRFGPHPAAWRAADGRGEYPLTVLRDRAGHEIRFAYGASGEPVAVTHSGGYRVDVTVDGGHVTMLAAGGTTLMRYAYDEAGRLAEVINASGRALRLSYDEAGRIAGYLDRDGTGYLYTYDDRGRCIRGESSAGVLDASYEYRDGTAIWTDATGAVHSYAIDASARLVAETDPLGGVTRYAHDARGRVIAGTDPLGRVTQFGFDESGNLVAVTRADGSIARAVFNDRCQAVELEEPGAAVWRQRFDDRGNRISVTQPDGAVIQYGYDGAGHLASVTGPDGATTTVECDARGLPAAVTGPGGAVTRYERDYLGHVTAITGPDGGVTAMTWTADGRPLTRTHPGGAAESWTWDANGNLLRHDSPAGAATSYEYGPFEVLTAVTRPDGIRTSFGYDAEMRLTSVQHGGLTWTYALDAAGRVTAETDYNGAVTGYGLDAAGQVTRRVNAAGQDVRYSYDLLGNVVRQEAADGVTTFGYDEAGDLVRAENDAATVVFERDALGRITAETCDGHTVRTSYDAAGRVAERITPSGAVSSWAYDGAGLPVSLTAGGRPLRFGHSVAGRETTRELPGGVTLTQDWDGLGRLAGQVLTGPGSDTPGGGLDPAPGAPAVLQRRRYAYSPDGYVTGLSDLMTGNRVFGLDAAGRVTAVTGAGWAEHYSYDPAGNISLASWPAVPPDLGGPDATPQGRRAVSGTLIRQAGNVRYRHDAAGRVIQRTRTRISRKPETWRYQWDSDSRLVAVATPDGSVWHYRYDALGRRVRKQQTAADGTILAETRFTWDGLALAEQAELTVDGPDGSDGSGSEMVTTWDYRPGSFTPLAQSTRTSLRDAPQDVIDGEFYAIVTNLTGTPTELVAVDGTLAGFQQQTLWGATAWRSGGASTPLRFPGQYQDDETGLHYNCQRFYDPASGAYLSPDPLGLAPSPNPHAYVPNPYVEIDPLGLVADDGCADLNSQINKVINYWDKTGRTPAGVVKGGAKGYERGVFTNSGGLLPKRPLGYYHESDVWPTGGVNRGDDRLVFGRNGEVYYTGDHYTTFTRIR